MSHTLAPVISEVFNMSIEADMFPGCLKFGRVILCF